MNEHHEHPSIDSVDGRLHALAGALYYVALIQHGLTTEQLFETLPAADQRFFERLVRLALEAAASWRVAEEHEAPVPVRARPALALVPRPEAS